MSPLSSADAPQFKPLLTATAKSFKIGEVSADKAYLSVENVGVGPALVRRFRVLYGGKSYSNPYVLVHDCCAYQLSTFDPTKFAVGAPVSSRIEGVVLKSGERRDYFTLNLAKGDEQAWKKLDAARKTKQALDLKAHEIKLTEEQISYQKSWRLESSQRSAISQKQKAES